MSELTKILTDLLVEPGYEYNQIAWVKGEPVTSRVRVALPSDSVYALRLQRALDEAQKLDQFVADALVWRLMIEARALYGDRTLHCYPVTREHGPWAVDARDRDSGVTIAEGPTEDAAWRAAIAAKVGP